MVHNLALARRSAVLVVALATVALSGGTAWAETPAARTVTPQRWVRQVCSSLSDWLDTTGEVDFKATDVADAVSTGKQPTAKARATLLKQYAKGVALTDTLVKKVNAVGVPSLAGGAKIAADFAQTLDDLRAVYEDARASTARLRANDSAVATKVIAIDDGIAEGFRVVGDPLEELQGNPELASAIADEPSCTDVEDAYHGFTPLDVAVGGCFTRNDEPVDCAAPHLGEVVFVGEYPGDADAPFPGDDAIHDFVEQNCLPAFADYVGIDLEHSKYDLGWIQPESETWPEGDRQMICYVDSVDESLLTGSVHGSVA